MSNYDGGRPVSSRCLLDHVGLTEIGMVIGRLACAKLARDHPVVMTNQTSRQKADRIKSGDFYEDCRYHPVLCVKADYSPRGDELRGISLVDGNIGSCSPRHCGPVKLTPDEAIERRVNCVEFKRGLSEPVRA